MKSANGGLLETLESEKYRIIIDDALKWLDKYKVRMIKFSIIIDDEKLLDKCRVRKIIETRIGSLFKMLLIDLTTKR